MMSRVPFWVALRKESVDRNEHAKPAEKAQTVALRKESVDRNFAHARAAFCAQVALRKESVDRNVFVYGS